MLCMNHRYEICKFKFVVRNYTSNNGWQTIRVPWELWKWIKGYCILYIPNFTGYSKAQLLTWKKKKLLINTIINKCINTITDECDVVYQTQTNTLTICLSQTNCIAVSKWAWWIIVYLVLTNNCPNSVPLQCILYVIL